jgi:hypothetical protein
MASPNRTSTFNPSQNYEHVYVIGGRNAQDWAINELQRIRDYARRKINDQLFRSLAVLSGLTGTGTSSTGSIAFTTGVAYVLGRAMNIPSVTVSGYSTSPGANEVDTVYLQWLATQINKTADATLVDPYTSDPVEDRIQIAASLVSANPDVLDESFEVFQNGLPFNSSLNLAWSVASGSATNFVVGYPPRGYQLQALQINSVFGTGQQLSITIPVAASTAYTFSMWVKTVYGQPDITTLSAANAFVSISNTTGGVTLTQPFITSGGVTLLGGYQLVTFGFTTGAGTSSTITIGTGNSAPTTSILIDDLLITTTALSALQIERHYFPMFNWTRSTNVVSPVHSPKTVLTLSDLTGTLLATAVNFVPDPNTASDITSGTVQTAVDQLSTQRALLNGSTSQVFSASPATALTQVPTAQQVQQGSLVWGGTATNTGNAYTISITPTPTLAVGMEFRFIANATSTGPATLTIGSTTFNIYRRDGTQSQAGDLISGGIFDVIITALTPTATAQFMSPSGQYVTQQGSQNYAKDTGTANAYAVTLVPAPLSITAGFPIRMLAANSSTGSSTLSVNGAAPVTINRSNGAPIEENDILADGIVDLVFDGTAWELVSTPNAVLAINQTFTASSATRGSVSLGTSVSLSTTPTTILTWSLTMPTTGPGWLGTIHLSAFSQILAPSNTAGTEVDVTWSIADNLGNSSPLGTQSAVAAVNNQIAKKHFHDSWITPKYAVGAAVTFTISASYSIVTGSESVAPQAIAPSTKAQWVFIKAN